MASAYRLLSKSKQVYASPVLSQGVQAVSVRFYAKEAAPPSRPALKGDELLKEIFLDVKNKFETAIGVFRKEKITIDPEDPAAVANYAKVLKMAREKADLLSDSQRIKYIIETRTKNIPDAKTYLQTLKEIRVKQGLTDELGAEAMMFDALEKVENQLKKPLMRNDKKGMALLMAEFDKVNAKNMVAKSFDKDRMRSNLDIFEWSLTEEETCKIDQLPQRKGILFGAIFGHHPFGVELDSEV